jgi:hypothetical protein
MNIRVNLQGIVDSLHEDTAAKKNVSIYISDELWERFKKRIGKAPASQVIEEVIRQLLDDDGGNRA